VGKANVRNRLRRTLADLFYQQIDKLALSKEVIVIVYPTAATASHEELSTSIDKILPKISH
jgi:ribonuclease P protein component